MNPSLEDKSQEKRLAASEAQQPSLARRERGLLLVCLLAFALLYIGIASSLNRLRSFWSPDSGARFAMIRNAREHGNLIYLHYANADVDPEGRFHPLGLLTREHLADGFLVHLPRGFCTHFPPLFPFLSGICYHLFGFGGLTVLPLLAGLGTLLVTYALAKQLGLRSRLLVLIAMGAATPLLIYSVVFWDHSLHILLTAIASYFLLRALQGGELDYGYGAGAALGIGVFFHELFGVLFVSLLIGAVVIRREKSARRIVLQMAMGFAPLLALWGLVNWQIYGIVRGPHFTVASNALHSPRFAELMQPKQIFWRALLQLVGFEPDWTSSLLILVAVAGVLALLYVACLWRGGRGWQAAPFVALLFAPITLGWLNKAYWAHGLFEVTPLLLLAFAFPTFGKLKVSPDSPPLPLRERGPGGKGLFSPSPAAWERGLRGAEFLPLSRSVGEGVGG